MQIDLNNTDDFTQENVGKLVGSVLDSQNWQLRVTHGGVAFLSEEVGNRSLDGILFRFETWCSGNGYVGFQAQHDAQWVGSVYRALKNNWPNPRSSYIEGI